MVILLKSLLLLTIQGDYTTSETANTMDGDGKDLLHIPSSANNIS
jgi:hypothetical protein